MRKKLFEILNKIYGILMTVSFFGGIIPLPPFLFAICVGGSLGETISVFIIQHYYPYIIMSGSIAIIIGLVAMYVGKLEGLSIKKVTADNSSENQETR